MRLRGQLTVEAHAVDDGAEREADVLEPGAQGFCAGFELGGHGPIAHALVFLRNAPGHAIAIVEELRRILDGRPRACGGLARIVQAFGKRNGGGVVRILGVRAVCGRHGPLPRAGDGMRV